MNYELELTDTYGGETNYAWVKREHIKVPDGTSNKILIALAREWAGWNVRSEVNDSGDVIVLRPRGLCQVLFITMEEA